MTAPDAREAFEQEIRQRCRAGDFSGAATAALEGYGPEVFGFLVAFHRDEADADEVFALFSERLWRSLPRFEWGCSLRTWAYVIARNCSRTFRSDVNRRGRRFQGLPEGSEIAEVAERVRTDTRTFLRTETKDRVQKLRESLSAEEQMLLSLRLDRKLSWVELARVLRDDEAPPTEDELKRTSARLRKRFQALKERLREMILHGGVVE